MYDISPIDLAEAVEDLAMCEFFPSDPAARASIMRLLAKICPHREALQWLVAAFTDRVGKWHGPVELRAILCTRYRPCDGIEAYSEIPGFTAQESESASLEQHELLKAGSWDEHIESQKENRKELKEFDGMLRLLAKKKAL